jgi:flagellar hook-associated protein 2
MTTTSPTGASTSTNIQTATTAPVTTGSAASNTPATTVSVASNTSAGAAGGSVINVSSLVSQLVASEEAPQQALIANQTQAVTAQVSALGTLQSALSTFQSALSSLDTPQAFNLQSATSSQPTAFTASASSSAAAGTYNVSVTSLASAQQIVSGHLSATGSVGDGKLQLSVGGQSMTISVTAGNDTLSDIANAINNAANNPGIQATVIQGTDGAHLLLSSTQTGSANTITVAETDGGTALAALTYGTGNTTNYTVASPAANAVFSVAGVGESSASNTINNAINGVSLTLLGPTTGTGGALTVANDTATAASNVASFVSAYNTLQGTMSSLGSFDSSSGTAGALLGSPALTGTQNLVQNVLYSFVGSSTYNSLASIGITTNQNGSLSLNSNTLQTALSNNFSAVSNLFSSSNGIATQLNSQITQTLGGSGAIGDFATTLQTQENALTAQTTTLNNQMSALTASLTQQYSALNALLSSLQTTSSQLSQGFASLPTVQGVANA